MIKKSLLFIVLLVFVSGFANASDRVALVIGNSNYKKSPLSNPVNDAEDMAVVLKKHNFYVIKRVNATKRIMRTALRDFGDKLAETKSIGLFFYAGHGIQVKGVNYLVPVNSDVQREDEIPDECLDANSVLRKMESAKNRLNIIILDACRDNPFKRSFRSGSRGLAEMQPPTGSIIAFATGPGSVAADGYGRNGLYTSKLLKHIKTPGITIERVLKKVRIDVINASGKKQVPWDLSSLTGDFYFSKSRAVKIVKIPEVSSPSIKKPEIKKIPEVKSPVIERKSDKPDFILSGTLREIRRGVTRLELKLVSVGSMRRVWVGETRLEHRKREEIRGRVTNLLRSCLKDIWYSRFLRKNGKKPAIAVAKIRNRTPLYMAGKRLKRLLKNEIRLVNTVVLHVKGVEEPEQPDMNDFKRPERRFPPPRRY